MVVEPESLCWLTGRMVKARDGETWAEEFARSRRWAPWSATTAGAWAKG